MSNIRINDCRPESASFCFSGVEMLQYKDVSFQMLASAFPELSGPYLEFSERLKVEGNITFQIISVVFHYHTPQNQNFVINGSYV